MNFPFAMLSVSLATSQDVGLMRVQRMQEPVQEAKEEGGIMLAEKYLQNRLRAGYTHLRYTFMR